MDGIKPSEKELTDKIREIWTEDDRELGESSNICGYTLIGMCIEAYRRLEHDNTDVPDMPIDDK